jgi:hypothetical protein
MKDVRLKHVYRTEARGRTYYHVRIPGQNAIRVMADYVSDEFWSQVAFIKKNIGTQQSPVKLGRRASVLTKLPSTVESHLRRLFKNVKGRAKAKGIPFDLTINQLYELMAKSDGKCALTGIQFDIALRGHCFRRPWAPSIDRIRADGPYSIGNVRLVTIAANYAKSDWDDETFLAMVKGAYGTLVENRP